MLDFGLFVKLGLKIFFQFILFFPKKNSNFTVFNFYTLGCFGCCKGGKLKHCWPTQRTFHVVRGPYPPWGGGSSSDVCFTQSFGWRCEIKTRGRTRVWRVKSSCFSLILLCLCGVESKLKTNARQSVK